MILSSATKAPSDWNYGTRDENFDVKIIILAAAAGLLLFIVASTVVAVTCVVVRRKLKGLDVSSNYSNQRPVNHYSRDVVNHKLKSEKKNQIAILDHESRHK